MVVGEIFDMIFYVCDELISSSLCVELMGVMLVITAFYIVRYIING